MLAEISHHGHRYRIALDDPIDLSLPLVAEAVGPRAWSVDPPRMDPVQRGDAIYTVEKGAPVNFRNVAFNPHGHGTHTESVGHISREANPVGALLPRHFFTAQLISLRPTQRRNADGLTDQVLTLDHFREAIAQPVPEALVIRTLPNEEDKRVRDWTGTNAPYLEAAATAWLRSIGIRHLLVDLPSVDRESDAGVLAAHHAFWDHPSTTDLLRTITEFIFVPNEVRDGRFILELQLANFSNDAAPSRPVLYALLP